MGEKEDTRSNLKKMRGLLETRFTFRSLGEKQRGVGYKSDVKGKDFGGTTTPNYKKKAKWPGKSKVWSSSSNFEHECLGRRKLARGWRKGRRVR